MYKIDYQHESKKLDVQTTIDFSLAGSNLAREQFFNRSTLLLIINLLDIKATQALGRDFHMEFEGKSTTWFQMSSKPFADDHCDVMLPISYDSIHEGEVVTLDKLNFCAYDGCHFLMNDRTIHYMQDYVALRFVTHIRVFRVGYKRVELIDHDFHRSG